MASVPEDTKRTISTDGRARQISSASSTSPAVEAPKDVPRAARRVGRPADVEIVVAVQRETECLLHAERLSRIRAAVLKFENLSREMFGGVNR